MLELARKVTELTGSASSLVHEKLPADDPVRRRPNIGRAVERLGWSPTIQLDEGLGRTIADFRARISLQGAPRVTPL